MSRIGTVGPYVQRAADGGDGSPLASASTGVPTSKASSSATRSAGSPRHARLWSESSATNSGGRSAGRRRRPDAYATAMRSTRAHAAAPVASGSPLIPRRPSGAAALRGAAAAAAAPAARPMPKVEFRGVRPGRARAVGVPDRGSAPGDRPVERSDATKSSSFVRHAVLRGKQAARRQAQPRVWRSSA